MGVTSESLTKVKLNEILLLFDTFMPGSEFLPVIFEPIWFELIKDGRFINDFKIVKKNVGKKVCCMAAFINSLTY